MRSRYMERGYSIIKPRVSHTQVSNDWKLAYGLECCRIWWEAKRTMDATGIDPCPYYPTEEEFLAARGWKGGR